MRGHNPTPQPGDQPRPNPGQPDPGQQYSVLDGGQDVQRPGYYFNAVDGRVRYFRTGEIIPTGNGVWYYLTPEPDVSVEHLRDIASRYGFDLEPSDLHLA